MTSTKVVTVKAILKALACDKLALHKGDGYYYFVYDDVAADVWEDRSVSTYRLNHLSFERWVEEGRDFLNEVNQKIEKRK